MGERGERERERERCMFYVKLACVNLTMGGWSFEGTDGRTSFKGQAPLELLFHVIQSAVFIMHNKSNRSS